MHRKKKNQVQLQKLALIIFSDIIQNKNKKSKEAWIYIGIH